MKLNIYRTNTVHNNWYLFNAIYLKCFQKSLRPLYKNIQLIKTILDFSEAITWQTFLNTLTKLDDAFCKEWFILLPTMKLSVAFLCVSLQQVHVLAKSITTSKQSNLNKLEIEKNSPCLKSINTGICFTGQNWPRYFIFWKISNIPCIFTDKSCYIASLNAQDRCT